MGKQKKIKIHSHPHYSNNTNKALINRGLYNWQYFVYISIYLLLQLQMYMAKVLTQIEILELLYF